MFASGGLPEEPLKQACISQPDIYGYNVCLWKAPFITATQIDQNPHRCLGASSVLKQTSTVPLDATEHSLPVETSQDPVWTAQKWL